MSDIRGVLDRTVSRVSPRSEDLARVRERASRLRFRRRVVTGALAIAVSTGGIALGVISFDQTRGSRPSSGPTTSPTDPSHRLTLHIENRSGDADLAFKAFKVLAGVFTVTSMEDAAPVIEETRLVVEPGSEEAARLLEHRLLAGAEVLPRNRTHQTRDPSVDLTLILGRDYDHYPLATAIAVYETAKRFVTLRNEGRGAGGELSAAALEQYRQHEGGLELYSYWPEGTTFSLRAPLELPDSWIGSSDTEGEAFGFLVVARQPPREIDQSGNISVQEVRQERIELEVGPGGDVSISGAQLEHTPIPGPTPSSDGATPHAIEIWLEDLSGHEYGFRYGESWIETVGSGAYHGGYEVGAERHEGEAADETTISYDQGFEDEAARMRDLLFPGARLDGPWDTGYPLGVVLGADFAREHSEALDAYGLVSEFGEARSVGTGAERFLADAAARYYRDDPGARLYGGYANAPGMSVDVTENLGVPWDRKEAGVEFYLTFARSGDFWTERVRVDDDGGQLKVVEAVLSVVGKD